MLEKFNEWLGLERGVKVVEGVEGVVADPYEEFCYFRGHLAESRLKYDYGTHKWAVQREVHALASATADAALDGLVLLYQRTQPDGTYAYCARRRH